MNPPALDPRLPEATAQQVDSLPNLQRLKS